MKSKLLRVYAHTQRGWPRWTEPCVRCKRTSCTLHTPRICDFMESDWKLIMSIFFFWLLLINRHLPLFDLVSAAIPYVRLRSLLKRRKKQKKTNKTKNRLASGSVGMLGLGWFDNILLIFAITIATIALSVSPWSGIIFRLNAFLQLIYYLFFSLFRIVLNRTQVLSKKKLEPFATTGGYSFYTHSKSQYLLTNRYFIHDLHNGSMERNNRPHTSTIKKI